MKKRHITKNGIFLIIGVVFLITSIICCIPERRKQVEVHGVNSSKLTLNVISDDEFKREEYIDAAGKITFAADMHYAVIKKKLNVDGHVEAEYYYDENEEPVSMPEGQFGILREYDEQGRETKITYVDASGQPVRIASGYVSVLKSYDENGNEIKDEYVDGNLKPIFRIDGYAGRENIYDEEGRCIQVTYLDTAG